METSLAQYIETLTPSKPYYLWELTLQAGGGCECTIEIVAQGITNAIARCYKLMENNPHIRESSIVKAIRRNQTDMPTAQIGESS